MGDQDPDQSKRVGSPHLPNETPPPASAQAKGKSIVPPSGFVHKKPFPLFPFGVPFLPYPIPNFHKKPFQQEASSSQFPITNLPTSKWATIWSRQDFQLVHSLLQKPYKSWTNRCLQLAVQRRMQLMLQLLPLMVNKFLKSGSLLKASQSGLDYNWIGQLVPVNNPYSKDSKQIEAEFVGFSSEADLEQIGNCFEKGLELNTESIVNELSNHPIPMGTIWSEGDFPEVESLQLTPYFLWSNTDFELALPKLRQLQLNLIQLKMSVGQISPLPGQQAIPRNVRILAQRSSTNNGQDEGNSNSKKDDTTED